MHRQSIPLTGTSLPDRPDPPGSQILAVHPQGPAGGAAHPARAGPGARLRLLRPERQLRLHPDPAAGLLGVCPCPWAPGRAGHPWGKRLSPALRQGRMPAASSASPRSLQETLATFIKWPGSNAPALGSGEKRSSGAVCHQDPR